MAITSTTNPQNPPARSSADAGRRRSSGGMMFSGLQQMKRDPMNAQGEARRQSIKEQTGAPMGAVASAWHNFTKGPLEKK